MHEKHRASLSYVRVTAKRTKKVSTLAVTSVKTRPDVRAAALLSLKRCQLFSLQPSASLYSNVDSLSAVVLQHGCRRRLHVSLSLSRAERRRAANLASFPRIPYRLHQLIMI